MTKPYTKVVIFCIWLELFWMWFQVLFVPHSPAERPSFFKWTQGTRIFFFRIFQIFQNSRGSGTSPMMNFSAKVLRTWTQWMIFIPNWQSKNAYYHNRERWMELKVSFRSAHFCLGWSFFCCCCLLLEWPQSMQTSSGVHRQAERRVPSKVRFFFFFFRYVVLKHLGNSRNFGVSKRFVSF